VACVPLYDGSTPVGSLILVAMAPRTFGERQIRLLEQPVRDLVGHIGSMRKRVSSAVAPRTGRPSLAATATATATAAAPPLAAPSVAGPTTPGVKVAPGAPASSSIQAAVDRARAELERLRARLAEADEATAAERARVEALEARQAALRAEHDELEQALAARTSEVTSLTERVAALEATLKEARRSEAALRGEIEQARGAALSEGARAAETLTARLAELEAANEELRRRAAELEAAEASVRADAEHRLARLSAEAEARFTSATDVEARAAALATECDALRAQLTAETTARQQAAGDAEVRQAAALAELEARHASALAEAEARATAAAATAADWQRRCESLEGDLAAIQSAVGSHSVQVDALARERAEREADLAAAREREATLAQRIAELEAEVAGTRAELERTRAEDLQLRDGFAHLESLIQTEVDASAGAGTRPGDGTSTFEVVELDAASASLDDTPALGLDADGLVVEEITPAPRDEAPAPAAASPAASAPARPPEGLLVLDVDEGWSDAGRGGVVTMLAPDATPGPDTRPERVLVNLAAPNALAAFATLRAGGITAPGFGCIAVPGQRRGLLVGRLELASRPIDPDALLADLPGTFNRGTRVVTAGADVDGLISLRQALARLGVSVSMAWDAKQAGDLLGMVHPEVAIIDLELPPKDGCALVARMGLVQPAPLIVVIPKPTDTAATFAAALAHPELGRMTVPAQELIARVAAFVLKPPPAVRR
jgi:CheY-like chemotaxis protein